jgi:hypothetical protein
MTHFAVLRHGFDIHRNPDRLGTAGDEKFNLTLKSSSGGGGELPTGLEGNALWLISWEGFMKTHHVVVGWFVVSQVGKRHGVVAQPYAGGDDGVMFPRGLGPLDMHDWFHKFVEANRRFREGEPTDLGDHVDEVLTLARGAGYRVPAASAQNVTQGPASV